MQLKACYSKLVLNYPQFVKFLMKTAYNYVNLQG